jgi:hypothetical protein
VVIRLHIVDADLQMFKAGVVQPLNPFRSQQVPIGDHRGNDAVHADAPNSFVQFRMQQRLTATEVMIPVPRAARRSTRQSISAVGTGLETLSYSLQYAQERLQRRIGIM